MKFFGVDLSEIDINIIIDLTTICQQHCPYCYARYNYKDKWNCLFTEKNFNEIVKFIKFSKYQFNICLKGGEPTLHPKFNQFMHTLIDLKNVHEITIFTNGKKSMHDFEKTHFLITYHPTESDGDRIINNIKYLKEPWIAIMAVQGYKDRILNFYNRCIKLGITDIDFLEIIDPKTQKIIECEKYLDLKSDKNYIYENNKTEILSLDQVLSLDLNHFKGWVCQIADIEIKINGSVHIPCINKDMTWNEYLNSKKILQLYVTMKLVKNHVTCSLKNIIMLYNDYQHFFAIFSQYAYSLINLCILLIS